MRRVGLVGKPLGRRHSKVMHDAAFDRFGIAASYELHELDADDLPAFVDGARDEQWLGFQVTAPYKQVVMGMLDAVEPDAEAIGAVNTVVTAGTTLTGCNTDAPGFRAAVERELERPLAGAAVVVVGAGGAAHAVVHACADAGAERITVANRTVGRAEALAERFAEVGARTAATGLDDRVMTAALAAADLLVNASTLGMMTDTSPCDVGLLSSKAAVFDCVYTPSETPLLRAARRRGLPAVNGLGMLVEQAAIAFERWTGVADAGETMRAALEPLLADGADHA